MTNPTKQVGENTQVKPQSVYSLRTFIRLRPQSDMTEHYKSWGWKGRARGESIEGVLMPPATFITCNLPACPASFPGGPLGHGRVCPEAVALPELSADLTPATDTQ